MTRLPRFILFFLGFSLTFATLASAQNLICNATAVPPVVKGEGIAERIGDIVLNCSGGQPNARITGNFSIFLNTNITNRVAANTVTDVVFTVDTGSGPQPVTVPGTITGPASLVYNGLSFTLSPAGTAVLRLANVRTAAIQLMLLPNALIQAFLGFNGGNLVSITNSQLTVGSVERALFAGNSSKLVCAPGGSLLPDTLLFSTLLRTAAYATTRVTEGFADAFGPRNAWANLNADSGERIIVKYSGFPQGARLFVPDAVAGSDAVQPTGAGDYGVPASGGQYAPSLNGSLLLARVRNTDANGAGGFPVYAPGPQGSGTVSFDSVGEIPLANGNGVAVYEVVDANANVLESAQFPTFLGLAPSTVNAPVFTGADVSLAPVSAVQTATASDPIPRFAAVSAPNDCGIVGDCTANYFPRLYVDTTPISYTGQAGSSYQVAYTRVLNQGAGVLHWTTSVTYLKGSGWLQVSPDSGVNNATIRIDASPGNLAPGAYQATLNVDAGPVAGAQQVPITLVVTAAPPVTATPPVILSVVNAASFASGPVAPGSLATLQGMRLGGDAVAVTFDGLSAKVLYSGDRQINVLVPAGLAGKQSVQVVATVNGVSSAASTVALASMAPAIFSGAVLNQDFSANSSGNPAQLGSVIQIFATGLSGTGTITGQIHDRVIGVPYYAGPAPGLLGVQQVDLVVPQDLPAMTTDVYVCGSIGDQRICSPPARLTIN